MNSPLFEFSGLPFPVPFPSLTQLIHEDKKLSEPTYSVVSGTATVERSAQYLQTEVPGFQSAAATGKQNSRCV